MNAIYLYLKVKKVLLPIIISLSANFVFIRYNLDLIACNSKSLSWIIASLSKSNLLKSKCCSIMLPLHVFVSTESLFLDAAV
jgi:hypothetical protein